MLLVCEKFGIRFVPELQMYPNAYLRHDLANRFGAQRLDSTTANPWPWLSVAADGRVGKDDPGLPYFNPTYPAVQQWATAIVRELAERYKDSPALQGVAIRLMGFDFGSWQAFGSIQWGYDDYTYRRFLADTGAPDDGIASVPAEKYPRRYRRLTGKSYSQWVQWRGRVISAYHASIAKQLRVVRPDLRLFVNSFGPHYAMGEMYGNDLSVSERRRKGWDKLIRETGVDPSYYASNPSIIFSDAAWTPAGVRVPGGYATALGLALFAESRDPAPIVASSKSRDNGSVSYARFYNEYMEADIAPKVLGLRNRAGPDGGLQPFRLCGYVEPAGRNVLARYVEAMAAGNLISIIDGGLGYFLGQPEQLRSFIESFESLPAVGMNRLAKVPKDVALWQSDAAHGNYVYLVNRSAAPLTVHIFFSASADVVRLPTRQPLHNKSATQLVLTMKPFELVAMRNRDRQSGVVRVAYAEGAAR